jgi:hypothetical protein
LDWPDDAVMLPLPIAARAAVANTSDRAADKAARRDKVRLLPAINIGLPLLGY